MLNSDHKAYCNGMKPECYKSACEAARKQCPAASDQRLILGRCPSSDFTECWETQNKTFSCLGRPRPTSSSNIDAYCFRPSGNDTGPGVAAAPAPSLANMAPVGPNGVVGLNGAAARGAGAGVVGSLVVGALMMMMVAA